MHASHGRYAPPRAAPATADGAATLRGRSASTGSGGSAAAAALSGANRSRSVGVGVGITADSEDGAAGAVYGRRAARA